MKTITFKKKLRFHKETIADLSSDKLRVVHGGIEAPPDPVFTYTECRTQCPSKGDSVFICCQFC
jgi:hypothetical protein